VQKRGYSLFFRILGIKGLKVGSSRVVVVVVVLSNVPVDSPLGQPIT
jgi:hypothetical protein